MNNGLNGEGKNIIGDVENKDTKLADNLTNFYNNQELSNNTQTANVYSGQTTLNKNNNNSKLDKFNSIEAPTNNESNEIYDFISGLKNSFKNFFNFKKINTEQEFISKMSSAKNITILIMIIAVIEFIFTNENNILKILLNISPIILLVGSYLMFKKNDRKAIIFGILSSILMICTFKILNIIFGIIYLIGILSLLSYKKKTQ